MRVLVCGGRTWAWARYDAPLAEQQRALRQRDITYRVLDSIELSVGVDVIIHGDARGADKTSRKWAGERCVPQIPFPANWHELGRKAGPLRNSQMLLEGRPDLVVAFPGGVGTADMVGKGIDCDNVVVLDLQEIENAEIKKAKDSNLRRC